VSEINQNNKLYKTKQGDAENKKNARPPKKKASLAVQAMEARQLRVRQGASDVRRTSQSEKAVGVRQ
jgi:hypothetical protein